MLFLRLLFYLPQLFSIKLELKSLVINILGPINVFYPPTKYAFHPVSIHLYYETKTNSQLSKEFSVCLSDFWIVENSLVQKTKNSQFLGS